MEIKDKKVLITGSAVRIGAAIATKLASLGAKIIIHYNNSEKEAMSLQKKLPGAGHLLCKYNLQDIENLDSIFKNFEDIDILINNASVYIDKPFEDEGEEEASYQYNINCIAPSKLMDLFAQHAKSKTIINLLDQRINKEGNGGSYIKSKKDLAKKTLSSAIDYAPNIRVNAIAPGPVLPPVWCKGTGMKKELKKVPLNKKVDMDDLTNACIFLINNESITGQILYVDCGQHLK